MKPYLTTALLIALLTSPLVQATSGEDQRTLRLWEQLDERGLKLRSNAALIADEFGNRLFQKHADTARPIASLTKLMTALVILDSGVALDKRVTITKDDRDLRRLTGSRLKYGATLTRRELLILALMSSENRASAALGRTFPGGTEAFVQAMNDKAKELGMRASHFSDPAGLDAGNVASPSDLGRLVLAANRYPLVRKATTLRFMDVRPYKRRGPLRYVNTNRLLRNQRWDIQLGKTGYINEAGRCLVMLVNVEGTDLVMVFLDSFGKLTPFGDANRTRKWLQAGVKKQKRASEAR